MWDYGGSQDDGDDDLPFEVLRDNAEDMLDNTIGIMLTKVVTM